MQQKTELIRYILTRGVTTAVNYALYGGLLAARIDFLIANCLAWCGAVLVSYALSRIWVFRSSGNLMRELFSFAAARFLTLAVETGCLWLLIDQLRLLPFPAKILVSGVTILGNYGLCKYKVFRKDGAQHG